MKIFDDAKKICKYTSKQLHIQITLEINSGEAKTKQDA